MQNLICIEPGKKQPYDIVIYGKNKQMNETFDRTHILIRNKENYP